MTDRPRLRLPCLAVRQLLAAPSAIVAVLICVPGLPASAGDDAELAARIGIQPQFFPTDRPPGPLQRGNVTTEEGNRIVMEMRRAVKDRAGDRETADLLLHYAFDRKFAKSDWIRDEAFRLFPKIDWGTKSASVAGRIQSALSVEREPWCQRSQLSSLASLGANAKSSLPLITRLQKSGKIPEVRDEATRAVELIRADVERVRLAGAAKTSKSEERATREKDADAANRAAAKVAREKAGEE